MPEFGEFTNFITKGYEAVEKDDRRIVKGHITVEVIDRQNEFVAVDEVLSIIKNYFDVAPAIHDWHSNRPVGKALTYKKSEIEGHPSVYIEAQIFKKEGVTLYDKVWEKIVKGEYTGFSMGGASKIREPMVKDDGKLYFNLKNLELYEISVCPLPANQLAIIDYVNDFAKASGLSIKKNDDGKERIQCSGVTCQFHIQKNNTGHDQQGTADIAGQVNMNDEKEKLKKTDETTTMVTPATVSPKETDFTDKKEKKVEKHHQVGLSEEDEYKNKKEKEMEKSILEITSDNSLSNIEKGLKIRDLVKQYQAFQKPVRGHPRSYWENKLKEENPEYTDDQVNATIGEWEKEEKEKAAMTKQDKGAGDNNEQAETVTVRNDNDHKRPSEVPVEKGTGGGGALSKAVNEDVDVDVDNTGGQKKLEEIRKVLQSEIRKSNLISMLLN